MNPNYLPGETGEQHRDRLREEMTAEVVKHKRAIIAALEAAGHKVQVSEDDLKTDYTSTYWKVNGESIDFRSRIEYKSGYYSRATGGLRFTMGPYQNRKTFVKFSAAKKLAKHPEGFDYADIARTMAEMAVAIKKERIAANAARKLADENDAIAVPAGQRLLKEFDLKGHYGDSFIGTPLKVDRGRKELGLEFHNLTEEQARAILTAARDCGALDEKEDE